MIMNENNTTTIQTLCGNDAVDLPITSLYISPMNTGFSMEGIDELSNSISTSGLIQSLGVAGPDDEGRYEILSGSRRFTAILKIREEDKDFMAKVPCRILLPDSSSDIEKEIIVEEANLHNRDDIDKMYHRKRIIRLYKAYEEENSTAAKPNEIRQKVVKRATDFFKIKDRYAIMFYNIFCNDENEDIENLLAQKKVTMPQADKIFHMDADVRESVVEDINNGKKAKEALAPSVKTRKPLEESNTEGNAAKNEAKEDSTRNETHEGGTRIDANENIPKSEANENAARASQAQIDRLIAGDNQSETFNIINESLNHETDYYGTDDTGYSFGESEGLGMGLRSATDSSSTSIDHVLTFLEDFLDKDSLDDSEDERLVLLCQDIVNKFS